MDVNFILLCWKSDRSDVGVGYSQKQQEDPDAQSDLPYIYAGNLPKEVISSSHSKLRANHVVQIFHNDFVQVTTSELGKRDELAPDLWPFGHSLPDNSGLYMDHRKLRNASRKVVFEPFAQ